MPPIAAAPETIAAVATATGPGGVGIVRVSGPAALSIADRIARAGKTPPSHRPARTLFRAVIVAPDTGEAVDDALVAVFRAPSSLTGEDVVEVQGHGGAVTLGRVLAACLSAGARAARPGEFTERAFVNGKMDLAQAEAVAQMVAAQTVAAQRAARRQLSGALSRAVGACGDAVREALARIEASIDFPEEVGDIDPAAVDSALARADAGVAALLATFGYGRRLTEGLTVVLAGRPNVGKSSLLNALARRDRAIVTPIAGTTRDVLEEPLNLRGLPVRALDTAGIRATDDPVESFGVARARQAVADADVVVAVLDASEGLTDDDRGFLGSLAERPSGGGDVVVVVNKADVADAGPTLADARAALPQAAPGVATAAARAEGIDALEEAVVAAATGGSSLPDSGSGSEDAPLVTSARHAAALHTARESLAAARATLARGLPAELIAVDAHAALGALGEITGETTREEIIRGIFATFCIGK